MLETSELNELRNRFNGLERKNTTLIVITSVTLLLSIWISIFCLIVVVKYIQVKNALEHIGDDFSNSTNLNPSPSPSCDVLDPLWPDC